MRPLVWLIPVLAGCGLNPFANDPVRLVSVNGIQYYRGDFEAGPYDPRWIAPMGEDFPITLVIDDPENRDVRVWWPEAPAGWEFDPDGTVGVWHVPELALPNYGVELVIEDEHGERQLTDVYVPIRTEAWWDTGIDSGASR